VERGVQLWVDGGWGIDALLGVQTRPHKDFDALVRFDDIGTLADALAEHGFTLTELWEENRWVAHPKRLPLIGRAKGVGSEVATAFVVRTGTGQEFDVHVLRVDPSGAGLPAWATSLRFPAEALAGHGTIVGTPVRCLSAQMQMATHADYPLQAKDLQDLHRLHEHFGVAYLEEQTRHMPPREN
jgi:lincosamide nucleotidyltransferase A/C/D/E